MVRKEGDISMVVGSMLKKPNKLGGDGVAQFKIRRQIYVVLVQISCILNAQSTGIVATRGTEHKRLS